VRGAVFFVALVAVERVISAYLAVCPLTAITAYGRSALVAVFQLTRVAKIRTFTPANFLAYGLSAITTIHKIFSKSITYSTAKQPKLGRH
jgi:hypothetical protein